MSENTAPNISWLVGEFVPPTSVAEALERGREYAQYEDNWVQGNLFWDRRTNSPIADQGALPGDSDILEPHEHAPKCTDVKACAAGIYALACLNGPWLEKYWLGEVYERDVDDAIFQDGITLLAEALAPTKTRRRLRSINTRDRSYHFRAAVGIVESYNDFDPVEDSHDVFRGDITPDMINHWSREAHHKRIVDGFERARDLAKERGL